MEKKTGETQKDDFWDLSALLPARRNAPGAQGQERTDAPEERQAPAQARKTALSEVLFKEHFVPPHTAAELERPEPLFI